MDSDTCLCTRPVKVGKIIFLLYKGVDEVNELNGVNRPWNPVPGTR
jgi:hypothetical protein